MASARGKARRRPAPLPPFSPCISPGHEDEGWGDATTVRAGKPFMSRISARLHVWAEGVSFVGQPAQTEQLDQAGIAATSSIGPSSIPLLPHWPNPRWHGGGARRAARLASGRPWPVRVRAVAGMAFGGTGRDHTAVGGELGHGVGGGGWGWGEGVRARAQPRSD